MSDIQKERSCRTTTVDSWRSLQAGHLASRLFSVKGNTPVGTVFSVKKLAAPRDWPFPHFPPAMSEVSASGGGSVDCEIELDGTTADCKIVASVGNPLFATAILEWLQQPRLRFEPMTRGGKPIVGRHIFDVKFKAAPGR